MQTERNISIDILRMLGTLLVILAHVSPPATISELRTFDVVLLVFISGICSFKEKDICEFKDYVKFIAKRTKRLVLPTYVMITLTVLFFWLGYTFLLRKDFFWSIREVIESYLLLDGIGYVWIVRVYMLIALICPLVAKISARYSRKKFTLLLLGMIGIYQVLYFLNSSRLIENGIWEFFIKEIFMYLLAYGLVVMIAMRFNVDQSIRKKVFWGTCIIFLIYQIAYSLYYQTGFSPSQFKYPPSLYYLSYGTMVSILLYYGSLKVTVTRKDIKNAIVWFSTNSFTIYLMHVPMVTLINSFSRHIVDLHWLCAYLLIILTATLGTWGLERVCKLYKKRM